MSTAIRRSLPLALLGLILGGCGSSHFDYEGTWVGNRNLDRPDLEQTIRYTAGKVTLEIHGEHFQLTQMSLPTAGEVQYNSGYLTLFTKSYMNRPLEMAGRDAEKMHPPITIQPQSDGSIVLDDPMAIDGKPVKLTRQKE